MQRVQLKSALKNGKKERKEQLRPNSAGVDFLNKNFNLYIFTDGKEGFDPRLRTTKDIKAIFAAHKEFEPYSEKAFVEKYKTLGDNFQLEEDFTRKSYLHG